MKRFDEYERLGHEFLSLVSLSECDVAVLPFDWQFALSNRRVAEVAERAAEAARQAGRKILVFFFHDSEEAIPLHNAIVFRTSMQRGRRQNEFAHPAWVDDYPGMTADGTISVRPKGHRPSVGFCGFAGYRLAPDASFSRRARARARMVYRRFPQWTVRERAIVALKKHPGVIDDFILRENFYAGVADGTDEQRERVRQVYVSNLIANDYILCARGGGNFSYRFYETLAAARPPLFIDTNCCLPYDFEIDYSNYGVFVDASDVAASGDRLSEWHSALSDREFVDLQRNCRELWERRMTPTGFFRHLHRHLNRV